jgi:hypothetical protein
MKCVAVIGPRNEACGAPAVYRVVFKDGDKAPMCLACALQMRQLAEVNATAVKVEAIDA